MMGISQIYCDNNFTMHVSQTIILYALNFCSDVHQLFLNNTE